MEAMLAVEVDKCDDKAMQLSRELIALEVKAFPFHAFIS